MQDGLMNKATPGRIGTIVMLGLLSTSALARHDCGAPIAVDIVDQNNDGRLSRYETRGTPVHSRYGRHQHTLDLAVY